MNCIECPGMSINTCQISNTPMTENLSPAKRPFILPPAHRRKIYIPAPPSTIRWMTGQPNGLRSSERWERSALRSSTSRVDRMSIIRRASTTGRRKKPGKSRGTSAGAGKAIRDSPEMTPVCLRIRQRPPPRVRAPGSHPGSHRGVPRSLAGDCHSPLHPHRRISPPHVVP